MTGLIASLRKLKAPRLDGWDDFTQNCFSQLSEKQGDFASQAKLGKAGTVLKGPVRIGQPSPTEQ